MKEPNMKDEQNSGKIRDCAHSAAASLSLAKLPK